MNLALRKIIYDPISYIHPQRVSLNNTPINNPVLRSITNEMMPDCFLAQKLPDLVGPKFIHKVVLHNS